MHSIKKSALAGMLLAGTLVSVPALAQPGTPSSSTLQSSTEFPGGIRATTSADANLTFVRNTKNVTQLRLTKGTATFSVPAGRELKLEAESLLVQSKTAEFEAGFDAAGRPQVTCLSGLVGVTDAGGNHFRLSDNSVFTLGADGNSPSVHARTVATTTPEPDPPPVAAPAPAPPPAPEPVVTNSQSRPWAGQNDSRDQDDGGGYQPPQQPQGPSVGQTILRSLPAILVNVLPYVLNNGNGYYPNQGYYPGYYPNQGYYPNPGYYPYR